MNYRLVDSWMFPIDRLATRGLEGLGGAPKATPELKQLALDLMRAFSTSARARNGVAGAGIAITVIIFIIIIIVITSSQ